MNKISRENIDLQAISGAVSATLRQQGVYAYASKSTVEAYIVYITGPLFFLLDIDELIDVGIRLTGSHRNISVSCSANTGRLLLRVAMEDLKPEFIKGGDGEC